MALSSANMAAFGGRSCGCNHNLLPRDGEPHASPISNHLKPPGSSGVGFRSRVSSVMNSMMQVGSVSYLNAKPLIYGLEHSPDLDLSLDERFPDGLHVSCYPVTE